MTFTIKNKELSLKILLILLMVPLVFLSAYVFNHGKYHLAQEDEATYYDGAKVFAETGYVRAARTNRETVSKIWQCDWYGPMYHIFYGTIDKISGIHTYNFIITNLICFLIIVILVLKASFALEQKLLIICSFLILPTVTGFIFTYFPETPQLLFAAILTLQLKGLYSINPSDSSYRRKYLFYVLLVIFFSLFRITSVFWILGLLPLTTSRKDFLKKTALCLVSIGIIFLYMSFFNAAYTPKTGIPALTNGGLSLKTISFLIDRLKENLYTYFNHSSLFENFQGIILLIVTFSYFITKDKFILAACIIGFAYYLVLATLYVVMPFYFNKQTACLYIILLVAFYGVDYPIPKYAMLSVILLISPFAFLDSYNLAIEHKTMALQNDTASSFIAQLGHLKEHIEGKKPVTILALYKEFDNQLPFEDFETDLPSSTNDKFPILYSYNFSTQKEGDSTNSYNKNFTTYGRIHIDYMLSKYPITMDSVALAYSGNSLYLYKNLKKN